MGRKRAAGIVVLLGTVLGLAGCAGQVGGTAAPDPSAVAAVTSSPAASTKAGATSRPAVPPPVPVDGTNVRACVDGTCAITVTGPIDVPLDGRAGESLLEITELTAERVRIRVGNTTFTSRPGPGFMSFQGKGGAANTLIRVAPAPDGTFVLELITK